MSSSSNVRLHPWRDGVDHCLRLLEPSRSGGSCQSNKDVVTSIQRGVYTHASASSNNPTIRSVDICFHPQDYQVGSSGKLPLLELFQAIQKLPNLESLIVRFTRTEATAWHLTRQAIPPVPALTAVLVSGSPDDEDFDDAAAGPVPLNKKMSNGNSRLAYLTCIGLPLFADDYDMNGFTELLRIHPSLTSIVIKDCLFAKRAHLEQLERVLAATTTPPKRKRHVELLSNTVVDTSKLPSSDGGARSWWSYLLCGCCILLILLGRLLAPTERNNTVAAYKKWDFLPNPLMSSTSSVRDPVPAGPKFPFWRRSKKQNSNSKTKENKSKRRKD